MNKYQIKWLKNLRSGEYPQAKGAFKVLDAHTDEIVGYCCLGVEVEGGCDTPEWEPHDTDRVDDREVALYGLAGLEVLDTLPGAEREKLGLTVGDTETLVTLNDTLEYGFDLIADVLEHVFRDGSVDVITALIELGFLTQDDLRMLYSLAICDDKAEGC